VLTKPLTSSALYNAVATALKLRQIDETAASTAHQQRLAGLRIQIVDDSDINREVAQRIFAGEGAHVELASDGHQAVDWLQAHPNEVDIVLMDLQMPVMSGFDATRIIRSVPALAGLPVVALTAGNVIELQILADEVGMNGFIAKPFDVETAMALIMKLTGRVNVAAVQSDVITPDINRDLPGLAVGRGLTIWKDPLAYRKYLRKFVRDYANIVAQMSRLDQSASASLAHKLGGAAGSLALDEVFVLAGEVDQVIRAGKDPADSFLRLQTALETVFKSIEQYAPPDDQSEAIVSDSFDPEQVSALLAQLLAACDTDSLTAVRLVLAELERVMPRASLSAIHAALESFDLRGAEAATRSLASTLNISLGA
jgi:hypothetical protein